jgi:hypothetical protein
VQAEAPEAEEPEEAEPAGEEPMEEPTASNPLLPCLGALWLPLLGWWLMLKRGSSL